VNRLAHRGVRLARKPSRRPLARAIVCDAVARQHPLGALAEPWRIANSKPPQLLVVDGVALAVGRRHGEGVYVGEDGVRFVRSIRMAPVLGRVFEAGSGSGVATVALAASATSVTAVDTVPACAEATRHTADLNGVGERVVTLATPLENYVVSEPFDCVAANLPGVPVPSGLAYPSAGNGGPDGLAVTRDLLAHLGELLAPASSSALQPRIVMRLQSPGGDDEPHALGDIRAAARQHHLDMLVVVDSVMPGAVRSLLTAQIASAHSGRPIRECWRAVASHASDAGFSAYYSSAVYAWPGAGEVELVDVTIPNLLPLPATGLLPRAPHGPLDAPSLLRQHLHELPMGFWEYGSFRDVERISRELGPLLEAVERCGAADRAATLLQVVRGQLGSGFDRDAAALSIVNLAVGLLRRRDRTTLGLIKDGR
jgi:hypothetical protein